MPGNLNGSGRPHSPTPATLETYRQAVELYRTTALTTTEIAERTGVSQSRATVTPAHMAQGADLGKARLHADGTGVGHPPVRYETLPQVHGPKVRPRHQEAERGRTLYGSGCRRIRAEPGNFPQVPARARAGTVRHARHDQAGEWEDDAAPQHGEICRGRAAV